MSHRSQPIWFAACLLSAAWLAGPSTASGALTTFTFKNITDNNAANSATGESQLLVDVFSGTINLQAGGTVTTGANQVGFRFYNVGPVASSITDIYFDDGTLLGIAQVINTPGVVFSQGANPGNLPGGNTVGFQTTAGFLSSSDTPTQPNGVNPGEEVVILFDLINGKTYQDTLAALQVGLTSGGVPGSLRMGIHVQGFANGGSESFINGSPPGAGVVPEPSACLIWGGMGLLGAVGLARRRRASSDLASGRCPA